MVYFLRCEQHSQYLQPGWIKIGTTARLSLRLKQIAAEIGHMPTVLAVLDGAFAEERALHERFRSAWKFGEWHEPCDDLLRLIETEGRPWDGIDEKEFVIITVRCRREYRNWLDEFARKERLSPSHLVDQGLMQLAKLRGFELPPDR